MESAKIAFREIGQGAPLILLHGYAGSVLQWDPLIQELQGRMGNQIRLVVPNLTHLFMSRNAIKFSEQIDIFAKFLREHFPKQKVHLCGLSYGGALVWGVSLRYPELVDRTVFINPMPPDAISDFSVPILKTILRLQVGAPMMYTFLRTKPGRYFLKRAASVFRTERADLWTRFENLEGKKLLFVSHVISNFSFILKNENWNLWKNRLETWTHPSLLIFDQNDPLFAPKTYHTFQDIIGCDEVEEVQNAGHIAVQTKAPEIAQMLLRFLNVKGSSAAA
jgi:pimeloyl-ACP methyl ester carboxylesterase